MIFAITIMFAVLFCLLMYSAFVANSRNKDADKEDDEQAAYLAAWKKEQEHESSRAER